MQLEAPADIPHNHNESKEEIGMNKKEVVWEKTNISIRKLCAHGGFAMLAQEFSGTVMEMTAHPATCVCCMDGRVASHEDAIAIAGSGILVKDNKQARARLVDFLRSKNVQKVFLHEDCGAVGLYAKSKNISRNEAEHEAFEWAQELTFLIGGEEEPETLPVAIDFHSEACVYLELTDRFSLRDTSSFPTGFQVTVPVVSLSDAFAQVDVSLNIAFSDHGFGNRFTRDVPFSVVVVAKSSEELRSMQLNHELMQLVARYDGRAVIDGFVLPTQSLV